MAASSSSSSSSSKSKSTKKPSVAKAKTSPTKTKMNATKPVSSSSFSTGGKKTAQQVILELAARAYSMGNESLERHCLTTGTSLLPKTVNNNLPKLRQQGLIEFDSKTVSLTRNGLAHVGDLAKRPTSNKEHQEIMIKSLQGKKEVQTYRLLSDGKTQEKDKVAKELGYDNAKVKVCANLFGKMKGNRIVEYPTKTTIRLTDACFIVGRENDGAED